MKLSIYIVLLIQFVLLGFSDSTVHDRVAGTPSQPRVTIERMADHSVYAWAVDKCRIELVLWKPGARQPGRSARLVSYRGEFCKKAWSFAEQLLIIDQLLDLIATQELDQLHRVTSLAWGAPHLPEEKVRLINAYLNLERPPEECSKDSCVLLQALVESNAFSDLEEVFEAHGLGLMLDSVEEVHRVTGRDLPRLGIESSKLLKPVPEESSVPYTAMIWFRVDRIVPKE